MYSEYINLQTTFLFHFMGKKKSSKPGQIPNDTVKCKSKKLSQKRSSEMSADLQ